MINNKIEPKKKKISIRLFEDNNLYIRKKPLINIFF